MKIKKWLTRELDNVWYLKSSKLYHWKVKSINWEFATCEMVDQHINAYKKPCEMKIKLTDLNKLKRR